MGGIRRISEDNCLKNLEYDNITNIFPIIRARFEEYGFTLDYEGSSDEYNEDFLSMVGRFLDDVKSSYLEYKYWTHPHKDCFEAMIDDFKLQRCPYKRIVTATNKYGALYLDGKRLCNVSLMEVSE